MDVATGVREGSTEQMNPKLEKQDSQNGWKGVF